MSSKLDQSLGDIIDSNKSSSRGKSSRRGKSTDSSSSGPVRRGRATRRNEPYNLRDSGAQGPQQWANPQQLFVPPIIPMAAPATIQSSTTQRVVGDTIHISNLDKSVTSDDLNDIFKPIGTIKSVNLHYDQNGSSIGTATITFQRRPDAAKAVEEFDGAEVDGRVMNIRLVGEVITGPVVKGRARVEALAQFPAVPPSLFNDFAQFRSQLDLSGRQLSAQGRSTQPRQSDRQSSNNSTRGRGGAKRSRGAARGGRSGSRSGTRSSDKPVSIADLDADLNSYHSNKSAKPDADKEAE